MRKIKRNIVFFVNLLPIFILLAHGIIPHHHHIISKIDDCYSCFESCDSHHQSDIHHNFYELFSDNDNSFTKNNHKNCNFLIDTFTRMNISSFFITLTVFKNDLFRIPLYDIPIINEPFEILKFFNSSIFLRGPPVF